MEAEHTIRYRKKIEKDEVYIESIRSIGEGISAYLKQNNSINLYEEYFAGAGIDHSGEPPSAKTLTVFRDPNQLKRPATSVSWYPDGARKVAISYSVMQFQRQPIGMSLSSYIWDISNPNFPELELTPASPLSVLDFNPKDPHILLGGCYNGLIQYFDDRKGSAAVDSSPIEKSHRDPVYDVAWMQSKTGTECCSVSTDGQIFWWDIRKVHRAFIRASVPDAAAWRADGVRVSRSEGRRRHLRRSVSCVRPGGRGGRRSVPLQADRGQPTKFLVGTEQGSVLLCNRKAKVRVCTKAHS